MDVQKRECFYCGSRMGSTAAVDHFIPWSRYQMDLGHNFVLAHASCNGQKSDRLASYRHLEEWCIRNESHHSGLSERFESQGIFHGLAVSNRVALWAYDQSASTGSRVWEQGKGDLVELNPVWRDLPGLALVE